MLIKLLEELDLHSVSKHIMKFINGFYLPTFDIAIAYSKKSVSSLYLVSTTVRSMADVTDPDSKNEQSAEVDWSFVVIKLRTIQRRSW